MTPPARVQAATIAFRKIGTTTAQWAISIALLLAVWQWIVVPNVSSVFVSAPVDVWRTLVAETNDGTVWSMIDITVIEAALGLVIGTALGIFLALLIGLTHPLVGKTVEPIVTVIYAVPKFVLAPVLFVWFGGGLSPRVLLVVLATFPIVTLYMVSGIRTVNPHTMDMMRLAGAKAWQQATKVLAPHSVDYLMTALIYAVPHAITVAIGAEILFGSTDGVGGLLNVNASTFNARGVFAALVVGTVLCALAISGTARLARRLSPAGELNLSARKGAGGV